MQTDETEPGLKLRVTHACILRQKASSALVVRMRESLTTLI